MIPFLIAVILSSNSSCQYWKTPVDFPSDVPGTSTPGSDSFIRKQHEKIDVYSGSAFYAAIDAYDQRTAFFSQWSTIPPVTNITTYALTNYGAFKKRWMNTFHVPMFDSSYGIVLGSVQMDDFIGNGFHPFDWCSDPYGQGAGIGWFPDFRSLKSDAFHHSPWRAGGIAWEIISQIACGDPVSHHEYDEDYTEKTFLDLIESSYKFNVQGERCGILDDSIRWKAIENFSQNVGLYNKAYKVLGVTDVVDATNYISASASCSYKGRGTYSNCRLVKVSEGSSPEDYELVIEQRDPISVGDLTYSQSVVKVSSKRNFSSPCIRSTGITYGFSLSVSCDVGDWECSATSLSLSTIASMIGSGVPEWYSKDFKYELSGSRAGAVLSWEDLEGEYSGIAEATCLSTITKEEGYLEMSGLCSSFAQYAFQKTQEDYGLGDSFFPTMRFSRMQGIAGTQQELDYHESWLSSVCSAVSCGGDEVPSIIHGIDYDPEGGAGHEYDSIEYIGNEYGKNESKKSCLISSDYDLMDKIEYRFKEVTGTETDCLEAPNQYSNFSEFYVRDMINEATNFTCGFTSAEFPSKKGIMRYDHGELGGEGAWVDVSNGVVIACSGKILAYASAGGFTLPESYRNACAVDTKRCWVESAKLTFNAVGGLGSSPVKMCFEENEVSECKYEKEFNENDLAYMVDGDDPVYTVKENGFKSSFVRCNNIDTVRFIELTNAQKGAFETSFAGCEKLGNTIFSRITTAEDRAFMGFARGSAENAMNTPFAYFPNLRTCGDRSFERSFEYSSFAPSNVTFRSLSKCGDYSFRRAFYDAGFGDVSTFSNLVSCGDFAFSEAFCKCQEAPSVSKSGDCAFTYDSLWNYTNMVVVAGRINGKLCVTNWNMRLKKGFDTMGDTNCVVKIGYETMKDDDIPFLAMATICCTNSFTNLFSSGWAVELETPFGTKDYHGIKEYRVDIKSTVCNAVKTGDGFCVLRNVVFELEPSGFVPGFEMQPDTGDAYVYSSGRCMHEGVTTNLYLYSIATTSCDVKSPVSRSYTVSIPTGASNEYKWVHESEVLDPELATIRLCIYYDTPFGKKKAEYNEVHPYAYQR